MREATKSEWAETKKSKIHNNGMFAIKDIPKGTKIIEYVGDVVDKKESDRRSDMTYEKAGKNKEHGSVYIFELNRKSDVDGDVEWNTARFINHSCEPNCEVEIKSDKIWVVAIKDIKKGDELGYDYGYDIDDFESHPCLCGKKKCVGYIVKEENWPKLKRMLRDKRRKARVRRRISKKNANLLM